MTGILVGFAALAGVVAGWVAAVGVAVAAVLVVAARGDRRRVAPWALLVVLAAAIGSLRHAPPQGDGSPLWIDAAGAFRGVVVTSPGRTARSQSFVLRLSDVLVGDEWRAEAGDLCVVSRPEPRVGFGDRLWLAAQAGAISDEPARFRPYLRQRGCVATAFAAALAVDAPGAGWQRVAADARDATGRRLRQLAPGDAGALMSGLVTGDDSALSTARDEAFRITGTTHITAVSGSNFATFVTLLVAAGAVGGWRRRVPWLALVVALLWAYAVFTGMQPPGTRAAIAASLAVMAIRVGRRPDLVTLLALAGGAMALADPQIVWRLSFQLSLAASLSLASVAEPEPGEERGFGRWVALALLATAVAQAATLPLLLPVTRALSAASLPANVAIAPLVAVAYPASLVATAFAWTPFAEAIVLPARIACEAILRVVDAFAAMGGVVRIGTMSVAASLLVAVACAAACASISRDGQRWWSQRRRRTSAGAAAIGVGMAVGLVAVVAWRLVVT